ncbi:MAG: hypothetical protein ABR502_11430 [Chitinophagaceae bacterium]
MSQKNKKQFGVCMDSHHATVLGKLDAEAQNFSVLGVSENAGATFNTSEKNAHNDEKTLQHKYFKEILTHMQNADEVHLTGTSRDQLMHYMAETAQFKNTITTESTSNKMSDENLTEYIAAKFINHFPNGVQPGGLCCTNAIMQCSQHPAEIAIGTVGILLRNIGQATNDNMGNTMAAITLKAK